MYKEYACLQNEIRIMRPQWENARRIALHHFKHRHDGRTSLPSRLWIQEFRRLYRAETLARIIEIETGAAQKIWNNQIGRFV